MKATKAVISFALWGDDPMYYYGAVRNIIAAREHYRGWECWFYCHPSIKRFSWALEALGAKVIEFVPDAKEHTNLYHRYRPIMDPTVDKVIFRDCDSIVNAREAVCVKAWTDSKQPVHSMRDHRMHTAPIMGGMWGCYPREMLKIAKDFEASLQKRNMAIVNGEPEEGPRRGRLHYSDQTWLAHYLWPLVKDHVIVHDNWKRFSGNELPVPHTLEDKRNFVGQAYKPDGTPIWKI